MVARSVLGIAAAAAVAVLAGSCAAKVDGALAADQSATLEIQVRAHPVLQAYLDDLAGGKPSQFSADKIRQRLQAEKGLTVGHIESSPEKGLSMGLAVKDLRQVLAKQSPELRGAFAVADLPEGHELRINLSRKLISALLGMAGMPKDSEMLFPQEKTVNAKQYREQLTWALEEYGSAAQLADMFKTARIKLTVALPGPVKSAKGFAVVDRARGVVALDVDILELLTMQGSQSYSAAY